MSTEQEGFNFYEMSSKLEEHTHALQAFGVLLNSSNLYEFSDENLDALTCYKQDVKDGFKASSRSSCLRWGLNQIVEMWIEKFERILKEGKEAIDSQTKDIAIKQ